MPAKARKSEMRVDITGWRFAQQVWGDSISRDAFVQWVRSFFSSRNASRSEIRVVFKATKRPHLPASGVDEKMRVLGKAGGIVATIYPTAFSKTPRDGGEVLNTTAHELYHLVCRARRRKYDRQVNYRRRPEEVKARKVGARWQRRGSVK